MYDLSEMFRDVYEGVKAQNERYHILNSEHIMDTHKGVEYHLEKGELWTVTRDGIVILDGTQMTEAEANILKHVALCLPKLYADYSRKAFYEAMATESANSPETEEETRSTQRYTP